MIARKLHQAATVAAADYSSLTNVSPFWGKISELASVVWAKCGREPYRMYLGKHLHASLKAEDGLARGWEIEVSDEVPYGQVLVCADGSSVGMGRLIFCNWHESESAKYFKQLQ